MTVSSFQGLDVLHCSFQKKAVRSPPVVRCPVSSEVSMLDVTTFKVNLKKNRISQPQTLCFRCLHFANLLLCLSATIKIWTWCSLSTSIVQFWFFYASLCMKDSYGVYANVDFGCLIFLTVIFCIFFFGFFFFFNLNFHKQAGSRISSQTIWQKFKGFKLITFLRILLEVDI